MLETALSLILVSLVSLISAGLRDTVMVDVIPSTKWGTWEGWGTSLCWWANVFGESDNIADLVFTTQWVDLNGTGALPGLGLNIARYNAGGSGWRNVSGAVMEASPHIPKFKQIEGFWEDWYSTDPSSSSWNWTHDAHQVSMLQKAQQRGANLLELFSNSPMWWACYNHNPSGSTTGSTDNLQSWNCDQHAVYLATIVGEAPKRWGVQFDSVEPFNEPVADWWNAHGTQEGCHFDRPTQASVVHALRAELNKRNLFSVRVAASDENTYTMALGTWNSFNESTRSIIGQVNVHGYEQGGGRRDLLYAAVDGKRLWNSEYGEGDASGMSLARNLHLDLFWLHNTAWVYWQVLDGIGWGLIQYSPEVATIGKANPKYYVLAHYSRHIRPEMVIIGTGNVNTVAAWDAARRRLVLVTYSDAAARVDISYNLTEFAAVAGPVLRWVTDTQAGGEHYVQHNDTVVVDKVVATTLAPDSVQTLEILNVDV